MDTSRVKHAPALPVTLPDGSAIRLSLLPPYVTDQILLDCKLEIESSGKVPGGLQYLLMSARRILEKACGKDLGEILYAPEILALLARVGAHYRRCHPPDYHLSEWLRRRVNDDADVKRDGWRAWLAKSAHEYYGRSQVDLTDGQVAYWQLLAAAYTEFFVDRGGKTPTKQWLKSET